MSNENEGVPTLVHNDVEVSTEERHQRALILDAKLEDALLESYQYMAEIIDEKLYKELGYDNARAYFEAKQISVQQAYRFAMIGRTYEPYLNDKSSRKTINQLGTSKIEIIARKLEDQIPALMAGETIKLGDEEYTAEDLKEFTVRDMNERIKKANKKLEEFEVETEKRKNAELERDHLKKENDQLKELGQKYREKSITQDQIKEDLDEFDKCWTTMQRILTRVEVGDQPEHLQIEFVERLNRLQKGSERFNAMHTELLLIHNDPIIQ